MCAMELHQTVKITGTSSSMESSSDPGLEGLCLIEKMVCFACDEPAQSLRISRSTAPAYPIEVD